MLAEDLLVGDLGGVLRGVDEPHKEVCYIGYVDVIPLRSPVSLAAGRQY